MTTNVYLENPPGNRLNIRQFDPGEHIHFEIEVRGVLGLPEPTLAVVFEIIPPANEFAPVYAVGNTNIMGNITFDVILPNIYTQATIRVTTTYLIGQEIVIIPIGIGIAPEPLPVPPSPTSIIENVVKWVAIGAGVIAVVWVASKAAPSVAQSYHKIKGG